MSASQKIYLSGQGPREEAALDSGHDAEETLRNGVERLKVWSKIWRLPRLAQELRIEFCHRLRRSLGQCHVHEKLIRLNRILMLPENRELLLETICHEAAHLAAHQLHGMNIKPHGPEWRTLLKAAEFEPRASMLTQGVTGFKERVRRQVVFEYHCPVCHVVSRARSRNSRYRCRTCLKAGRSGLLTVHRLPNILPRDAV